MAEKTDITSRRYIQEDDITFASLPKASDEALAAMAKKLSDRLET